jgi:hypothetical protein
METKPCGCCKNKKPKPTGGNSGYGYNPLEGTSRDWATTNHIPKSEYCVRVKGGRKFGGPKWAREKCGDGTMGFSTRRRGHNEVRITYGLDGQQMRQRTTIVNKRSSRTMAGRRSRRIDGSGVSLLSNEEIRLSRLTPATVKDQIRDRNKIQRKAYYAEIGRNKLRRATRRARRLAS